MLTDRTQRQRQTCWMAIIEYGEDLMDLDIKT